MATIQEKVQSLLTNASQAHHNADLFRGIGIDLLTENKQTVENISNIMIDQLRKNDVVSNEMKASLEKVEGGPENFLTEHHSDVFLYNLVANSIVMHHSIFDELLSDLLNWIGDEKPELFEGALSEMKISYRDLANGNVESARSTLVKSYLKSITRESMSKKVDALFRSTKRGLPDLNNGYKYDAEFTKRIDDRRKIIIHEPYTRVNYDDIQDISTYMRQSSLAFIFTVLEAIRDKDE